MSDKAKAIAQWFRKDRRGLLIGFAAGVLSGFVPYVVIFEFPVLLFFWFPVLLIVVVQVLFIGSVVGYLYNRSARKP